MTRPDSRYWEKRNASNAGARSRQRLGAAIQSPVLSSGGNTILTSVNAISGLVYWVTSIGGVHCCQYGPSPRVKLIVPFQPSNLPARSALTRSSVLSLLAAFRASAMRTTVEYPLRAPWHGSSLNSASSFLGKHSP